MNGDAPGPKFERTIVVRLAGVLLRQIAVLDDLHLAIDLDYVADFLCRFVLANNLRRHLGSAVQVKSNQSWIADLHQWIVDLTIK